MLERQEAKELIKGTIKTSIINYAKNKLTKKAKFQILDLLIPKERKIRSIVGGLETSLGTTLWEPLAKALASSNGFEVISLNLESPVNMPANLSNGLQNILNERKLVTETYNATQSKNEIKRICQAFVQRPIESFETAPKGFGVDVWLKKDGIDYFFDTKTVQPNVGAYSKFVEQILNWYAYYFSRFPNGNAEARIVFPYNPHDKDFWTKTIGGGSPLEKDNEGWVENQFWDFCSGFDCTFELIKECFIELRESKELEDALNSLWEE